MRRLTDILYKVRPLQINGDENIEVNEVCFDSRLVRTGDLFVAVKGMQSDGHGFIPQALKSGAAAIVCEELPENVAITGATFVKVADSSEALGIIASNYFGNPTKELHLIGITGTNGKTTCVTLLYRIFTELGYCCGLLSTIRNIIAGEEIVATHTTPDPLQINRLLRKLADEGGSYCFMEVSSHAVDQQRIAGLKFTGGVFTNITHDHLDYHKTFQEYLIAKKKFFDHLPAEAFALINADDRNSRVMVQNTPARVYTYALKSPADFKCRVLENQFEGLQISLNDRELFCRLTGEFNAYNLSAVYGTAILAGQDPERVLMLLSAIPPVEGRFETLHLAGNITGIIDYAHTPDALKNVLTTVGDIRTRNEKLITVVGAGGDRDKAKRPVMAKICAEKSDLLILTSDNPRSEDPEAIIREMLGGIEADHQRKVMSITNRKEAIRTACNLAKPGDIILIAGKGHEKYQEIKEVRYPFDDKKILEEMFNQTNHKPE
ncbi:MAG: UDP-N-acetylmuramoyl-L-alanyl-D-glutamate--2,6-diaminopimelate ligase [Bacteroidales bacterium]|nr:UDP-N-acetylmuramoyl-L-alanyl-D-glutamate--2,6-diaminopimelate ligase [Bacteroidales bacterium]